MAETIACAVREGGSAPATMRAGAVVNAGPACSSAIPLLTLVLSKVAAGVC